jgi:peroxiredoxin
MAGEQTAGKRVVIFGLPGAFTPTCSAKHVPGYVEQAEKLRAAGLDETWCVSVNDAFVMGAWAHEQRTTDKVRMMADGSKFEVSDAASILASLTDN